MRMTDPEIPLSVELEAFNPFIPLDEKNSGIPCAILTYTLKNNSKKSVPYQFSYHLGNRHVSLQVGDGWVRYQHDHVLDEMVRGLGLEVVFESAPFEPEGGAYGGHSHVQHTHDHGAEHNHKHSH